MSTEPAQSAAAPTLRRTMNLPTLVFFGLAYMVPMTIFSTYGLVTETTEGHLPAAYILTTGAMLFTAFSYACIVRRMPTAGSAYGYARSAFGPGPGFLTGWAIMIDYMLLPLANYLLLGIYLNAQFPALPAWVPIIIAIVLVTTLNVLGIDVVKNINVLLVVVQLVFMVLFVVLAAGKLDPNISPLAPFWDANASVGSIAAGASVLALSFLGFDAVSTLAEEAKDPRRNVPRAVILTVVCGGVLFMVISWFGQMVWPDYTTFEALDTAPLELVGHLGGAAMQAFFLTAYLIGCFASATASQASTSRVLYSMGRDRVLPQRIFGVLHPRFQTPVFAILVIGVVSLLAIVLTADFVFSIISFGALAAFSIVNLAVIKFFIIDRKERGVAAILKYAVVPLIGFALTVYLWFSLDATALITGLVWVGIGVVYLAFLSKGFRKMPKSSFEESGLDPKTGQVQVSMDDSLR